MTDPSQQTMVEVSNLQKAYGSHQAVAGLSFKVSPGEVLGFLGPNGAGKSTTMKMLTGFLVPTGGWARIGGLDVREHPLEVRQKIGYLPENAPLYEDMMVLEFLQFAAELRQIPKADLQPRLRKVCEQCGLMGVLGKDIGHLSKGFRQRVGLAQAILHDPDLLILDEPTSGLDPNQIVEIRELIKDIGREKTVILSTHILPEVQATCSRIVIISDGKLVADDTPENLTTGETGAIIHVVVKSKNGALLDRQKIQSVLTGVSGVRSIDLHDGEGEGTLGFRLRAAAEKDPREAIFAAAVQNELVLLNMNRERVSLEDTFRRLTQGGAKNDDAQRKEAANA